MKLNPFLVRGYVLLAGDFCRLAWWVVMVVSLVTNYRVVWYGRYAELRKSLSIAKWQMGLHPA